MLAINLTHALYSSYDLLHSCRCCCCKVMRTPRERFHRTSYAPSRQTQQQQQQHQYLTSVVQHDVRVVCVSWVYTCHISNHCSQLVILTVAVGADGLYNIMRIIFLGYISDEGIIKQQLLAHCLLLLLYLHASTYSRLGYARTANNTIHDC